MVRALSEVILTHIILVLGWIGSLHDGFLFEDRGDLRGLEIWMEKKCGEHVSGKRPHQGKEKDQLVGGLEHEFCLFHILGITVPTD